MERLTYLLLISLGCCFCFLGLIIPTNSTQSGLGPQISLQLSGISQGEPDKDRVIRDVDAIKKRATATQQSPSVNKVATTTAKPSSNVNDTVDTKSSGNDQKESDYGPSHLIPDGLKWSPDLLKRMLVVLLSITAIAVFYFIFRTLRLRRNRKTRKYGVLTTNSDHLEMAPLDQEEDDEDMTVFEANSRYK